MPDDLKDREALARTTALVLCDRLDAVALQLDRWAGESVAGGWSTHLKDPMMSLADDLRRVAAHAKELVAEPPGEGLGVDLDELRKSILGAGLRRG